MNERLDEMYADPRYEILADVERLLESSKIWGGMEYTYLPLHPAKYRPVAKKIQEALSQLHKEYGIEE